MFPLQAVARQECEYETKEECGKAEVKRCKPKVS